MQKLATLEYLFDDDYNGFFLERADARQLDQIVDLQIFIVWQGVDYIETGIVLDDGLDGGQVLVARVLSVLQLFNQSNLLKHFVWHLIFWHVGFLNLLNRTRLPFGTCLVIEFANILGGKPCFAKRSIS